MTTDKRLVTHDEMRQLTDAIAKICEEKNWYKIYGVPRGGVPVAMAVANRLYGIMTDNPEEADVIIDDIYDSGATAARYKEQFPDKPFLVACDKRVAPWSGQWLVMPWELADGQGGDKSAEDIVVRLLQYIGEDPTREGLKETPRRFLAAWEEWSQGIGAGDDEILAMMKTFQDGAENVDEMVIVNNIPILSKCEHHLADIIGIAHIGYVPDGKIVGISKLARLAEVYARRLQVQERLTTQIADTIVSALAPKGVGVLIRATHHCMTTRGVLAHGTLTTTSAMRGAFMEKPEARAEFLALCRDAEARGT